MATAAHASERSSAIFLGADLDQDPHGIFRRERSARPFVERPDGAIIVLRAEDVRNLVTDPRTRQAETDLAKLRGLDSGRVFDVFNLGMLTSNGENHQRRRAPMSRAFAFRVVRELRPRIRAAAERLLDRHHAAGRMNLLDDYAAVVPAWTISDILGLPEEDIPTFTRLVYAASAMFTGFWTSDDGPALNEAVAELLDYTGDLIARRRREPTDDFITAYVQAADAEGVLSPAEILVQLATVIIAGSDTTRAAVVIQTALLLAHPDQWAAVRADPERVPGAVREALRFEPAVASLPRFSLESIPLDGDLVPESRWLVLSTLSAMRDPALYAEPDRFDIARTDHPHWHMVFGGGPHRCLGEALAIVELEEALAALAARSPDLRVAGDGLRVTGHAGIRRVEPVSVSWR